jgi:hypothetical protein
MTMTMTINDKCCKFTNEEKNTIFYITYKLCKSIKLNDNNINNIDNIDKFDFFGTLYNLKQDGFNITKHKKIKKIIKFFYQQKMKTHYDVLILFNLLSKIKYEIYTINFNILSEKLSDESINNFIETERENLNNNLIVLKAFSPLYYQPPNSINYKEKYDIITRYEIINRLIELCNYLPNISKFDIEKITIDYAKKMDIRELCNYYNNTINIISEKLRLSKNNCSIYIDTNRMINEILLTNKKN